MIDEKTLKPQDSSTMGEFHSLNEREQKMVMMRVEGAGSKEIAGEVGLTDSHVRHLFAQNGSHRNEKLIAAVKEIREGLAEKLKGIQDIINTRLRNEITSGEPEFAHKYITIARDFLKDMEGKDAKDSGSGSTKISALIQNVYK